MLMHEIDEVLSFVIVGGFVPNAGLTLCLSHCWKHNNGRSMYVKECLRKAPSVDIVCYKVDREHISSLEVHSSCVEE